MAETVLTGFYQDLQSFRAFATVVNDELAIVPPSYGNGWLLVIRRHGVVIVNATSMDACFYLAKILIDRKVDLDSIDALNSVLKEIFGELEALASSTENLLKTRWELIESGDITK